MKIALRYYTKTGNTKKLAQAMAGVLGVEALDLSHPLEEEVDLLFLGNSYYAFSIDPEVVKFITSLDKDNDSEEIVCAGISALTQTFYFSLLELLNFDESDIYDKQTDGYLMIRVSRKLADNEKVQLLFNSLKLGLDLIRMQFSENLKIEIQEVQND